MHAVFCAGHPLLCTMGAGPVHVPAAHAAGNPVSTRQLFTTLLAISLGTVIEWYDYSVSRFQGKMLLFIHCS